MNQELDLLIAAYLDQAISPPQMTRLNAILCEDAEARRDFAERLNLDSALAALAAGWEGGSKASKAAAPIQRWSAAGRWAALAAGVTLLAGMAWWWQARPYARIVEVAGVEGFASGGALRGGRIEITRGSLALVTARGAQVVIEAPAEFRFESAQRLRLTRGRLAAEVPPSAKGFTVITPSGDAVDLGTRFGVDVPGSDAAEVHVFEGEVIAQAAGASDRKSLREGDAVSFDAGAGNTRDLRSAAFIQADEIHQLSAGLASGQRARSDAALNEIQSDPALIAVLDFEQGEALPGTYRRVQGRWPGSNAPEFIHLGDHLKLDAGGGCDWPQLTLAAWVRLDRLGAPYQSLLHTDGWESSNPGQVHWMVTHQATMRLALRGNTLAPGADERENFPDSRTPVLPEQGRWMHLATVYDAGAKTVRFYLNGQFDNETRQETAHPARLGRAQIGNWNRTDRKLSGRVDELVLLGRALTDAEIRALYEAGNPYR